MREIVGLASTRNIFGVFRSLNINTPPRHWRMGTKVSKKGFCTTLHPRRYSITRWLLWRYLRVNIYAKLGSLNSRKVAQTFSSENKQGLKKWCIVKTFRAYWQALQSVFFQIRHFFKFTQGMQCSTILCNVDLQYTIYLFVLHHIFNLFCQSISPLNLLLTLSFGRVRRMTSRW